MLSRKHLYKKFAIQNYVDEFYFVSMNEKFAKINSILENFQIEIKQIDFNNIPFMLQKHDMQCFRIVFFGSIYFIGDLLKKYEKQQ